MAKIGTNLGFTFRLFEGDNYQYGRVDVQITDIDASLPIEPQLEEAGEALNVLWPIVYKQVDDKMEDVLKEVRGADYNKPVPVIPDDIVPEFSTPIAPDNWRDYAAGVGPYNYYVIDDRQQPLEGVGVRVSEDDEGYDMIGGVRFTDNIGRVTFEGLSIGKKYYFWCYKEGYTFKNPDEETVKSFANEDFTII